MWHALADAGESYTYCNSYRYVYADRNSYANSHGYVYSYANGYSNSNGDCVCVTQAYADAQAATHATSTPISSSV